MSNITMQQIGEKIKAARIEQRLSRQQLGERISPPVTQQAVGYWETGEKTPTLMNFLQLKNILGLPELPKALDLPKEETNQ